MELEFNDQTQTPEMRTLFAEVIVPRAVANTFTYRIPLELNDRVQVGSRVIVQFGKRGIVTGIIYQIKNTPPKDYQAKYILELLDDQPIVLEKQLKLWQWISEYYVCELGEVLNIALPSGFKLSSQSFIQLNPSMNLENVDFTDKEQVVINTLQKKASLTFEEAAEILQKHSIYPIIKSLLKKEVILIYEQLKQKYKPKIIKKIRLNAYYANPDALNELLNALAKKNKQQDVILHYLVQIPVLTEPEKNNEGVLKSDFLKSGISNSSYKTLRDNGVFDEFDVFQARFAGYKVDHLKNVQLSDYQQDIVNKIEKLFEQKNTVLLHGITGSGKTEMYVSLIEKTLQTGKQVLFLLPEIALTAQIVVRLQKIFGNKMGVYHSKFSDNERVEIWKGVLDNTFPLVVGVRSAVMLPFSDLGLIIVDEEHDSSYKQHDPAPRYNARDMAMVMANLHNAKVLLGSATPSLESYYLASLNRYGMVEANKRYGDAQLPDIELVDLRIEKQMKTLKNSFSSVLLQNIQDTLHKKEQIVLFQNRRGYAPQLNCDDCGHVPQCQNCSVSLTYHLSSNELRCHYCGHSEEPPTACPKCSSVKIKMLGFGTEKIEDELKLLIPEAAIQRMDLDSTRSKHSYQNIIQDFSQRNIDILVGTQMVTKGLDFDFVSLVGVFDVDRMLHFPDFRSHERTFQLVTQVSGRAGRKDRKGKVLVQTNNPEQAILRMVLENDFQTFYKSEILEREKYNYPPFSRMIKVIVKYEEQAFAAESAVFLAERLKTQLGNRVLGAEQPLINRIRNQYLQVINIKLERDKINLKQVKTFIRQTIREMLGQKKYKPLTVVVDVDPM